MSYGEDILRLRARIANAMESGALDETKETFEAVLIQIMNDAEKNRQNTVAQAENLRKQAATLDGQAAAFSSVVSIVYNVVNGFIRINERAKEQNDEDAEQKAQIAEAAELERAKEAEELPEVKDAKKSTKQNKKKLV